MTEKKGLSRMTVVLSQAEQRENRLNNDLHMLNVKKNMS